MRVSLIRYTPEPELTIAAAARLCYSQIGVTEILDRLSEAQMRRLLQQLISSGHHSVLEHASFTFGVDGLSRASSHQLVRHRLASFSQQSQRYVSLDSPEYVTPPSIAEDPDLKREFELSVESAFAQYRRLIQMGVPKEDARYVLPNAITTRLVMTMNARELMHVCSVRLCLRAQWEIRGLFEQIREEVRKVAPVIGDALQIKCITSGFCDERESCGIRPLRETT